LYLRQYALFYTYVPNALAKRAPLRPAHLALANEWKKSGKLQQAGAMVAEEPLGGLLTFHAARSDVERFARSDPYVSAAEPIVSEYKIREWSVVIGAAGDPNNYAGIEQVKAGDAFPKGIVLQETNPGTNVELDQLLANKKVILFGVPGAFTPGCSKTHLPGYIADAAKIRAAGIDEVICVSINDAFVMAAWGEQQGAAGKVRMLADTTGELTRRLGLALDLTSKLASVRSKRYSLLVENGVITQANVEPEGAPTGLTCSLASAIKLPKPAGKL
jgi:2-Cys peroxiredoxin 5